MVPILITMDLEIAHDYDINGQGKILGKLRNDLRLLGLPISIFTTSESIYYFPSQIKMLHAFKHEIGCHGLNHSSEENYKKMPAKKISKNISLATNSIGDLIQEKPVSFRGPGMSTSTTTQKILIENGYKSDFSVCSQRIDFLNSKGGDIRWLFSPRSPYHPSDKNPYIKGEMPIWVIPLSSIGIPFISGVLYLFGLRFMKLFFHFLIKEAIKTNKPIVYLFHSYEFTQYLGSSKINRSENKDKRQMIHRFYEPDHFKRYKLNINLLKYILSHDFIRPFTGKEYSEFLNNRIN